MPKLRNTRNGRIKWPGKSILNFNGTSENGHSCAVSPVDSCHPPHTNSLYELKNSRISASNDSGYLSSDADGCLTDTDALERLKEEDEEYYARLQHPCSQISFCVFLLCCLFVICTFAFPHIFSKLKISESSDTLYLEWEGAKKLSICAFMSVCGIAAVLGITCTCFTWTFTYLDSHTPGVIPPSPLSDNVTKYRSGHTFHLNYMMSILNGLTLSAYSLWRLKDCFLVHH